LRLRGGRLAEVFEARYADAVDHDGWLIGVRDALGGRRHFIAQENEPESQLGPLPNAPRLSRTELNALTPLARGHAQKAIGYELGLSPSRVSRLLRRSREALGLALFSELARVARAALLSSPEIARPRGAA
jgi:DNA-binding CsgD family transcriptional regulator